MVPRIADRFLAKAPQRAPQGLVPPRPPVQVGHYEDTFRKVDDTWLLATRTLFLSFAGPTERLDGPGQS